MTDLSSPAIQALLKQLQENPSLITNIDILFVPVGNTFEGIKVGVSKLYIEELKLFGNSIDDIRKNFSSENDFITLELGLYPGQFAKDSFSEMVNYIVNFLIKMDKSSQMNIRITDYLAIIKFIDQYVYQRNTHMQYAYDVIQHYFNSNGEIVQQLINMAGRENGTMSANVAKVFNKEFKNIAAIYYVPESISLKLWNDSEEWKTEYYSYEDGKLMSSTDNAKKQRMDVNFNDKRDFIIKFWFAGEMRQIISYRDYKHKRNTCILLAKIYYTKPTMFKLNLDEKYIAEIIPVLEKIGVNKLSIDCLAKGIISAIGFKDPCVNDK